jgi:WD40 repeat protein
MAIIRAPYPSIVEDVHGQSVISIDHLGAGIVNFINRAGQVVATLETEYHPGHNVKAIRRIGSYFTDFRDVLIKDWYRPNTPIIKMTNPSSLPTAEASTIAWNPDGRYVAIGFAASPWFHVYKRQLVAGTFAKIANPANLLADAATGLGWSQDGKYLFAMSASSYHAYYLDASDVLSLSYSGTGFLTPIGPRNEPKKFRVTRDGNHMVLLYNGSPWIDAFVRDLPYTGVFNRLTTSLTASTFLDDAAWTQDSKYLAIGSVANSPFLKIYKRTGNAFVELNVPISSPVRSVAFSLDDGFLAVGLFGSPFLQIYKRDQDQFTKIAEVTAESGGYPTGQVFAVDWSPDGKYITTAHFNSPYTTTYKLGYIYSYILTKLPNPAVLPGSDSNDVRFAPDGKHAALAHANSPFLTIYKSTMGPVSGPAERIDPNAPVIVKS